MPFFIVICCSLLRLSVVKRQSPGVIDIGYNTIKYFISCRESYHIFCCIRYIMTFLFSSLWCFHLNYTLHLFFAAAYFSRVLYIIFFSVISIPIPNFIFASGVTNNSSYNSFNCGCLSIRHNNFNINRNFWFKLMITLDEQSVG